MMRQNVLQAFLGLMAAIALPAPAWAETVMEKVARTEVLTVGTHFDAVPYSYIDDKGNLVGYSNDLIKLIQAQLSAELGRDIIVQHVEAKDPAGRIPMLKSGQIDIACDTQFSWERDRHVDFSMSYGLSGIRLLVQPNSGLGTPESLAGKRIGVLDNSLGQSTMKLVQPQATLVAVDNPVAALDLLADGQVDALAGDTVVMAGLAAQQGLETLEIAPTEPYQRYGIACMVPEGNSTFLNNVNYAIASMLQGYLVGEPDKVAMVNDWFGPDGIVPIPEDLVREFFGMVLIQRAQVPPTSPSP